MHIFKKISLILLSTCLLSGYLIPLTSCAEENSTTLDVNPWSISSSTDGDYISIDLDDDAPTVDETNISSSEDTSFISNNASVDVYGSTDVLGSSYSSVSDLTSTYPVVRNQGTGNTCWAFATMATAEFSMISSGYTDSTVDYSELALAYSTFNSTTNPLGGTSGDTNALTSSSVDFYTSGGNSYWALETMANGMGAVSESDVPYENYSTIATSGLTSDEMYNDEATLKDAYFLNISTNASLVKEMIQELGAVSASYYDSSSYYNSTNNAYYCDTEVSANHAVAIVGWDDSFSASNFSSTPDGDGAWLIRNSWGTNGESHYGYFWLSYYDQSLSDTVYAAQFTSAEDENIYAYDGSIMSADITTSGSSITGANIFTACSGANSEYLDKVCFETSSTNVSYTVKIYTDLSDTSDPTSGTLQSTATTSGTISCAGIHTIDLTNAVQIASGASYAVVVTLSGSSVSLVTEMDYSSSFLTCNASISSGQSLVSSGSNWTDVTSIQSYLGNLRIKAYTEDSDELVSDGYTTYVTDQYEYLLGRTPSTSEIATWVKSMKSGTSAATVTYGFLTSTEFTNRDLSNSDFVAAMYYAMLGRSASSSEISSWTTHLDYGQTFRAILQGFSSSAEFQTRCSTLGITSGSYSSDKYVDKNYGATQYIYTQYSSLLGRTPDTSGLENWAKAIYNGGSAVDITSSFIQSTEFQSKGYSDSDFIELLYNAMLGRSSDSSGLANWTQLMEYGMTYRAIIQGFVDSTEFINRCNNLGISSGSYTSSLYRDQNAGVTHYIYDLYNNILGRTPDTSGLEAWSKAIITGSASPSSVAYSIFSSSEANTAALSNNTYISKLYTSILFRSASSSEISGWVTVLNNGSSRKSVFNSFVNSSEYNNLLASYGL